MMASKNSGWPQSPIGLMVAPFAGYSDSAKKFLRLGKKTWESCTEPICRRYGFAKTSDSTADRILAPSHCIFNAKMELLNMITAAID